MGPLQAYFAQFLNIQLEKHILQLTESTQHLSDSWNKAHYCRKSYVEVSRTSLHSQESKMNTTSHLWLRRWGIEINTVNNGKLSRAADS